MEEDEDALDHRRVYLVKWSVDKYPFLCESELYTIRVLITSQNFTDSYTK